MSREHRPLFFKKGTVVFRGVCVVRSPQCVVHPEGGPVVVVSSVPALMWKGNVCDGCLNHAVQSGKWKEVGSYTGSRREW
jgi:hypothetical protein